MFSSIIGMLELIKNVFFLLGYFSSSKTFDEKLSMQEEELYIRKWHEEKDYEARDILITHNLRLVAHVAKKYSSSAIAQEDLLSIGSIGLIKGVTTFAPQRGTKFASYVAKCIDNEILMALRSENKTLMNVYLNDIIGSDPEGNSITLTDIIGEENEDIISKIYIDAETEKIKTLFDESLDGREKEIINMRYGLSNNERLTQKQIAEKLNISRSYVSRIEKKALDKLAKAYKKLNYNL